MKSLIWERYEKGHTGAESTRLLDNTVNIALDTPSIKIPLWENTYDYFTQFSLLKFFFKLKDTLFIGKYARAQITDHLALVYEVSTTFIIVCTEAKEIQMHSPYKSSWIIPICLEMDHEIELAEMYLSELME